MVIKLFRYILKVQFFKKRNKEPNHGFSGGLTNRGAKVKTEGNYTLLVDKNGDHIPVQTKLVIKDVVNQPSTVTVTFLFGGYWDQSDTITVPDQCDHDYTVSGDILVCSKCGLKVH